MTTADLDALKALTFDWTSGLKDVWVPSRYHIEGLHAETTELIRRGISEARASNGPNPLGIAIQGQGGAGKTHLLGWAREQVQDVRGYFFLVGDLSRTTFWEEVLGSIVQQLLPIQEGKWYQLETLLADLADRMDLEKTARDAVTGQVAPTRDNLNAFITRLRRMDAGINMLCQDTARALVLLASPRQDQWEVGSCFLSCDDLDTEERRAWGIRSLRRHPKPLITELSRLLALSGPSLAVDFVSVGFQPRYPTWPIRPVAFEDARRYTARELLQRIEAHVRWCLHNQTIRELNQLGDAVDGGDGGEQRATVLGGQPSVGHGLPVGQRDPGGVGGHDLAALDARFAELREGANVSEVLDPQTEDLAVPPLLRAGLESWVREREDAKDSPFFLERPPRKDPPLHACLRMMVDARTERQRRWSPHSGSVLPRRRGPQVPEDPDADVPEPPREPAH